MGLRGSCACVSTLPRASLLTCAPVLHVHHCPSQSLGLGGPREVLPMPRDLLWPWPGSCSPDVPTARSSSRQAGASGLGLPELRGRDLSLQLPTRPSLVTGDYQRPLRALSPELCLSQHCLASAITLTIIPKLLPSLQPLPTTHSHTSCSFLSLTSHRPPLLN